MTRNPRLLIVDDEQHVRTSLAAWFGDEGYQVRTAANGEQALELLHREGAEILLVDIHLPGIDGIELQRRVSELSADSTVIIITAHGAVETAVEALKQGAYDYVVKPFNPEDLSRLVRKAAERYSLMSENRALRQQLAAEEPTLIFDSHGPLAEVVDQIDQVASTDTNVLIQGDSGTGKEVVARLIHARSLRRHRALVVVNCGALAEGVLESELFGHERGAFTGAVSRHRGKIELAAGGTLFLDEIGDIPPKVQVDLLRVLQEHKLTRVGGNQAIEVDFRLVTATHRDLQQEIDAARFRADLFFRINVFSLRLPPLKERLADIPLLAEYFRRRFAMQMNRRIVGFTREAMGALCAHDWPGNVRELQNAIERAVVLCRGGRIDLKHLPFAGGGENHPVDLSLTAMEDRHIRRVLAGCGFNVSQAARTLGIDRVTLYSKMKRYGIERPEKD